MNMYMIYLILNTLFYFFLIVMILVGVSFLTLLERKILGYVQLRKGPNKVSLLGFIQPFSDALKLFSKEFFLMFSLYKLLYLICPLLILFISILSWVIFPIITNAFSFELGILFMFCCMGLNSFPLMLAGWSSKSIYPLLGSMRSCAQVISYEVSFIIITLSIIFMMESYNFMIFNVLSVFQLNYLIPVFLMFFISSLAELNRVPFDFIEGESELVSGFNTEYTGVGFSLIFMGEYCSIMFMSMVIMLFFVSSQINSLGFVIMYQLMISIYILVRGALPRMRYDELMYLCWKIFLPMSLSYLFFVILYKWSINILLV